MFDIGWAELLVIGVVALIVIGPEDLPQMFRQVGRFTAKLRQMGREFQRAMDQAAKETGVKDVAKDLGNLTSPKSMGLDAVKSAADKFEKWDPIKNAAKPTATRTPGPSAKGEAAADAADAALEARTSAATASMMPAGAKAVSPAAAASGSTLTPVSELGETAAPKGPATQALYDKQAAKQAVLADSAARLRAIEAGDAPAPSGTAKRRPRPTKSAAAEGMVEKIKAQTRSVPEKSPATEPARTPRAPRTKKGDQA